ncbi:MAG: hydrogenase/urease maturation nickel metallochaperone HypA [Patescibacteria group bacterium]
MHDFLLSKQIVEELQKIIQEKKLENVKSVSLEIGSISMSHDGHPEHLEEIDPENLRFGLESLAKDGLLKGTRFNIRKIPGNDWKITDIEV